MTKVLCKSDYQDIYRIKDGVILIVNKFKYIKNNEGRRDYIGYSHIKHKKYIKKCQDTLCVITQDYYDQYNNKTYNAGQVIYNGYPVVFADRREWNYQIKTTATSFSGDLEEIIMLLYEIIGRIVSDDV